MSIINLIQNIKSVSKALQNARDANDQETVEDLEDELYALEQELEDHENSDERYDWS